MSKTKVRLEFECQSRQRLQALGLFGIVLCGLASGAAGCSFDPDDRCDADQKLYAESARCVCKLPKVWSTSGCVLPTPMPSSTTNASTTNASTTVAEAKDAGVRCTADADCGDAGELE